MVELLNSVASDLGLHCLTITLLGSLDYNGLIIFCQMLIYLGDEMVIHLHRVFYLQNY